MHAAQFEKIMQCFQNNSTRCCNNLGERNTHTHTHIQKTRVRGADTHVHVNLKLVKMVAIYLVVRQDLELFVCKFDGFKPSFGLVNTPFLNQGKLRELKLIGVTDFRHK